MSQPYRRLLVLTVIAACSHQPAQAPASAPAAQPAPPAPEARPPGEPRPPGSDPLAAVDAAGKAITADVLRDHITKVASDEFEGRGPTTRGDQAMRAYLVEQLKALGYEPGNGEAWEQPVELVGLKAAMPVRWTFTRAGKSLSLAWWDQYIAGSGVQTPRGGIKNAELVFVGYGIQAPEYGWDDFKGKDLKGKVLVMLNNDPDWDPALFAGTTRQYYGRWGYKYESAARQGAAGAIIIRSRSSRPRGRASSSSCPPPVSRGSRSRAGSPRRRRRRSWRCPVKI
jgi:hypothetical protein